MFKTPGDRKYTSFSLHCLCHRRVQLPSALWVINLWGSWWIQLGSCGARHSFVSPLTGRRGRKAASHNPWRQILYAIFIPPASDGKFRVHKFIPVAVPHYRGSGERYSVDSPKVGRYGSITARMSTERSCAKLSRLLEWRWFGSRQYYPRCRLVMDSKVWPGLSSY